MKTAIKIMTVAVIVLSLFLFVGCDKSETGSNSAFEIIEEPWIHSPSHLNYSQVRASVKNVSDGNIIVRMHVTNPDGFTRMSSPLHLTPGQAGNLLVNTDKRYGNINVLSVKIQRAD
jgi:hypothetical protein